MCNKVLTAEYAAILEMPKEEQERGMGIWKGPCVICLKDSKFSCTSCIKAGVSTHDVPFYCDGAHRRYHWTMGHKNFCGRKPSNSGFIKKQSKGANNTVEGLPYYVAAGNLEDGHFLFAKKPLVHFPKRPDRQDEQIWCHNMPKLAWRVRSSSEALLWTCISCYEIMLYGQEIDDLVYGNRMNKCLACGWPVHFPINNRDGKPAREECRQNHEEECEIFVANDVHWDSVKSDKHIYFALGVLRALLLPKASKEKLLKLDDSIPDNRINIHDKIYSSTSFVRKFKLEESVSDEELSKIIRILCYNLVYPPATFSYFSLQKILMFSIYEGDSSGKRILPHDCNPNCEIQYIPESPLALFKTVRTVAKDEILTISYIEDVFPKPVNQRAQDLENMLTLPCRCPGCNDPTESETYLSALRVLKRRTKKSCGYSLPYVKGESSSSKDLYSWHCNCQQCGMATFKQGRSDDLLKEMKQKIEKNLKLADRHKKIREILQSFDDQKVHPNHATLVYGYLSLALITIESIRDKSDHLKMHEFLPEFEKAIELLKLYRPRHKPDLGIFLFYKSLMKIDELVYKVSLPDIEGYPEKRPTEHQFHASLESIIKDYDTSLLLKKENLYFEMFGHDDDVEKRLRITHGSALVQALSTKSKEFTILPVYTVFLERFLNPEESNDHEQGHTDADEFSSKSEPEVEADELERLRQSFEALARHICENSGRLEDVDQELGVPPQNIQPESQVGAESVRELDEGPIAQQVDPDSVQPEGVYQELGVALQNIQLESQVGAEPVGELDEGHIVQQVDPDSERSGGANPEAGTLPLEILQDSAEAKTEGCSSVNLGNWIALVVLSFIVLMYLPSYPPWPLFNSEKPI